VVSGLATALSVLAVFLLALDIIKGIETTATSVVQLPGVLV